MVSKSILGVLRLALSPLRQALGPSRSLRMTEWKDLAYAALKGRSSTGFSALKAMIANGAIPPQVAKG